MDVTKVAAIDIGSNGVRILISRLKKSGDVLIPKKELLIRVPLRLGEDTFEKGYISALRIQYLIKVMKTFSYLMQIFSVDAYMAFCTSALREARNSKRILQEIHENAHIYVSPLSGLEVARIIYESHAADHLQQNSSIYVDVGGGCTEIAVIDSGILVDSRSFDMGTVRMLQGKVGEEEKSSLLNYLSDIKERYSPMEIIGSGGNINSLYRLIKPRRNKTLSVRNLHLLYKKLYRLSVEARIKVFDLSPDRADVIIPACEIFLMVAKATDISMIVVPTIGLVDGMVNIIADMVQEQTINDLKNKQTEDMQTKINLTTMDTVQEEELDEYIDMTEWLDLEEEYEFEAQFDD